LKILHISTRDYGGAAIAAIRLHLALLKEGVDSEMLFLERKNPDIPASRSFYQEVDLSKNYWTRKFKSLIQKISSPYAKSHRNEIKLAGRNTDQGMFSLNQTDIDISDHPSVKHTDIIHLHWCSRFVDFSSFPKINKPIVWTLHDMNPFTGGCHFSKGCKKYEKECKNCPQIKGTNNPDHAWLDQEYKRKHLEGISPIITAPSVWMKNCSEKSSLFGNYRNIALPNSVDQEIFKPLEKVFCRILLNWPLDKKILLFVSEEIDNPRKGFDLLLDALQSMRNPEILTFVIGISCVPVTNNPNIIYQGRIFDERLLSAAYSAVDALVIPSREDNLPNTMLESLACGTPVISFPVGGIPEIITQGVNGLLADKVNSECLAKSILEFFRKEKNFDKQYISEEARKFFSTQIQAKSFRELYQQLFN
jgi:glycosyltransferase involved in cell wall biosynthesis